MNMNKIIKLIQEMELVFARVTTAVVAVSAIYISIFWGPDSTGNGSIRTDGK